MYINSDEDRNIKMWREGKVQKLIHKKSTVWWETKVLLQENNISSRSQDHNHIQAPGTPTSRVKSKIMKQVKIWSLFMIEWNNTKIWSWNISNYCVRLQICHLFSNRFCQVYTRRMQAFANFLQIRALHMKRIYHF